MNKKIKNMIISVVSLVLVAVIGSLITGQNTKSDWYLSVRPEITPPNWVFPVVWNILFILIGCSLYLFLRDSKKKSKNIGISLFVTNFILNVLWSYFFFSLKRADLAFLDLILLWISTLALIKVNYKTNKLSSILLIPYLVWLSFAGILNYLIL